VTLESNLKHYIERIWNDFVKIYPEADNIHKLLQNQDETVINDHIAFRTFALPQISAAKMAERFLRYGYNIEQYYEFPEKNLRALHLQHFDVCMPKIFISALILEALSDCSQHILKKAISQIPDSITKKDDLPFSGRHWQAGITEYHLLKEESEYAAWLYAHGFHANHFTISVHDLKTLKDISALNDLLKQNGFKLNSSGGEIKGTPADFLEQSSTLASPVKVSFKEGIFSVPGGYYEFAKRYTLENKKLFQGFIASSANKIFESTDRV